MTPRVLTVIPFTLLILIGAFAFTHSDPILAKQDSRLVGRLLVASPKLHDRFFGKSVVYIVDHDANGALGVIINKVIGRGELANLMRGFGLRPHGARGRIDLHFGGPVQRSSGFVLHTSDYRAPKSRIVGGGISFTSDMRILKAQAEGAGPKHMLFAIGYAGWHSGQLELEIARGDWLVKAASQALVFENERDGMWDDLSDTSVRDL